MRSLVAVCVIAAVCGCKYNKETVPLDRKRVPIRVPHQQKIVALAVEDAVESLDVKRLEGKTVSVSMTGVFPHSDKNLFDYVMDRLESKLTRAGIRVIRSTPVIIVSSEAGVVLGDGSRTRPSAGALTLADPPDYRLLIGISWAGLDTRDKVRTDERLLTKQLGVAVGGFLSGLALFTIADRTYGFVLAGLATVGGPGGAYYWSTKESPFKHTYTLLGRARIVIDAIPTKGGEAFNVIGEGTSKIVIDENATEGYMLR